MKDNKYDKYNNFEEVNTYYKQLAFQERETYIATLNHDLKTPTIAQIRSLELLLNGQFGQLSSTQKEIISLTLDSCNYMYNMIHTLLSTYKFENGDVSLNYSCFDIVRLIEKCINKILPLSEAKSLKIIFNTDVDSKIVFGDKKELSRVVENLLSNGINYAFSSSVIHVSVSQSDGNFVVKVRNSSPYISPEKLVNIFKKYTTHVDKYNKVGVGLGLYLSKKIIEAHNGTIIAESSPFQINTFGFIIPGNCASCTFETEHESLSL